MSKIIKNSIITPDGTELVSTHRHDYVSHIDKNGNTYAVDGGNEYLRRSFDKADFIENSVYIEDDISNIRDVFMWATYGKDGKQPLKYKKLSELEHDHILAIIDTQHHLSPETIGVFKRELEFRSLNEN